jgi:N6-adenosine-specific RNA methylase IME4
MSKLSLSVEKAAPKRPPRGLPPLSREAIAEPGAEAIEQQVATVVRSITDPDLLLEWLSQATALARYLATRKGAQGPMQGAQRRIEARIGEMLGPAENRGPRTLEHDPRLRLVDPRLREDFRLEAHAFDGVELSSEEWRHSRRFVIRLIRERLGLVPETPELPAGQFSTIVADPPWQLDTGEAAFGSTGSEGHEGLNYFSMSLDDIRALGERLAPHLPENAHLYLWTTNRYVEAAYQVARDWGFKPSVLLVWAKAPLGVGLGDAYKLTTEFALFARRGSLANLEVSPTTWFNWPRGGHSVKPAGFYELAERMSPGPRLEMFARTARPGWTAWGDEAPS